MKLTENHHRAIDLMAAGMKNVDIAKQLDTAPETISRWRSDYDFQAELNKRLKEHQHESQQRLRSLTDTALLAIESVITGSDDDKSRLQAAFKILELVKLNAGYIGSDNSKILARDDEMMRSLEEFGL